MTPAGALPDEAVELFRETPDAFIAARDALVARLRNDMRDDGAKAVKALRKPTVAAWALNQLAVRNPEGVQALLDAGAEVRASQQAALSSKRGAAARLQAAGAARKGVVSDLSVVALTALAETGRGADAHVDAIVRALETSSVDPDAGAALAAGTFERPPAPAAGFGGVFGLTSLEGGGDQKLGGGGDQEPEIADGGPAPKGDPATVTQRARPSEGRAATAERTAVAARSRRDRDAAARHLARSRQAADGFAHELEGMRRRLEVVERKHADAASAAAEAETQLARAEKDLRRATERAEREEPGFTEPTQAE